MCVKTIVLTRPTRPEIQAATGNEKAENAPDSRRIDRQLLANASTLNRAANF
jgi:hypothetical protein